MKVAYTNRSIRMLARLPTHIRSRLVAKVEQYAADPMTQTNNVKQLSGREELRLRVGDYRVIFTVTIGETDSELLTVIDVGHRSNIDD